VADLCGTWDFVFLGDCRPEDVRLADIRFDDVMAVPGCFDATPAYAGKRGLAAYRTSAPVAAGQNCRLVLDGVQHWGRVFVNGRLCGEHVGGFTSFAVDFAGPASERAEIVILVDNRFDAARCPIHLPYYDWYQFGGIARGVWLHQLPSVWIDRVQVTTVDYATRKVSVVVHYGVSTDTNDTQLTLSLDGEAVHSESLSPHQGGTWERTFTMKDADLWSPASPHLHSVHVRLGEDDFRQRFGIRQVQVSGKQLLMNGQPLRLLGFCRHEAHPEFGMALPQQVLISDLQLLKDMGCNFVRGSHYPQDGRFLDLCDELGICMWCESVGWQNTAEQLSDARFLDAQKLNIAEMIAAAYNHPSVILWGLLNEGNSHRPESRPAYEELIGHIRRCDASRPVTFASNHPFDDVCMDLADVTSINMYPGWYHGNLQTMAGDIDMILGKVHERGFGDRPVIISEIGGAAIYGCRDWNHQRWTESYQAELLETAITRLFRDGMAVTGIALWQFCDIRTLDTMESSCSILGRPRGFNNKGVMDEYRRPKQSYEVVKRLFRQLARPV